MSGKTPINYFNNLNVNHSDHYKNTTSLECIEAMQLAFGRETVLHFCLCNSWKYIWRWKNKNGKEDLEKALWYVDRGLDIIQDPETSPSLCRYDARFKEAKLYINDKLLEDENE